MRKILITLFLVRLPVAALEEAVDEPNLFQDEVRTVKHLGAEEYQNSIEEILTYIREHEGYKNTLYECPGGMPTIGYGHVIRPKEDYLRKDKITLQTADSLLRSDFEHGIRIAQKDGVYGFSQLGIAHFVFCLGEGAYKRSTLRKLILEKSDPEKISAEWEKWAHVKGRKHPKLLKARRWEAAVFIKNLPVPPPGTLFSKAETEFLPQAA